MNVLIHRGGDFEKSLFELRRRGGAARIAADQVTSIIGRLMLSDGAAAPDELGKLTKHGESRIPHAFKFDLKGACRLVCIRHAKSFWLLFVGNHAECERWLDQHRGFEPTVDTKTKRLTAIEKKAFPGINPTPAWNTLRHHVEEKSLLSLLDSERQDELASLLGWKGMQAFSQLTVTTPDDDLLAFIESLPEKEQNGYTIADMMFNLVTELLDGTIERGVAHIARYIGTALPWDQDPVLQQEAITDPSNSDVIVNLRDLSEIELRHFFEHASFEDWMLYLHPDQKRLIDLDFNGPALLRGVSGSGKTSVLVHRAKWLAERYPEGRIGVFTLNRALAGLISRLLDKLCPQIIRSRIDCRAIYDLCHEVVSHFEPGRHLQNVDPRSGEHLEDCWHDSFGRTEQQELLKPIIRSLHETHAIDPSRYLRDEFIWIRSAFTLDSNRPRDTSQTMLVVRSAYAQERVPREGRSIPFSADWRLRVLESLTFYEEWLTTGGFVDPAALSLAAHAHIGQFATGPEQFRYRCVLVDEEQDLGNLELEIIRSLVPNEENALFLCGDLNQQVFPKAHDLRIAGIEVSPRNRRYLRKNYRNTRQILEAGLAMLNYFGQAGSNDDDVQAIDPELSAREASRPLAVAANQEADELQFIVRFVNAKRSVHPNVPFCIVACGIHEDDDSTLAAIANEFRQAGLDLTVLQKNSMPTLGAVFLSALETVKGFEFSLVIIARCGASHMPDQNLPKGEIWRDARRLYVAMTRARDEVVFTYCAEPSPFVREMGSLVTFSTVAEQGLEA